MRFKNEADYQRVVEIFERLNFPINNAGNKDSPAAPRRILGPTPASVIQSSVHSYVRDQPSISDVAKNCETRDTHTLNDACYALPRPFLTDESPFFRRSHTASSDTARPRSEWSLDGSRASDTVPSISFGEPLVRPSSVLDNIRPISMSQSERTVCKYLLHPFTPNSPLFTCVSYFSVHRLIRYVDRLAHLSCVFQS